MNEESYTKLFSFITTINNDYTINIPSEELEKIFKSGINEIRIDIYGNIYSAINNLEIDINIFNKVKSLQKIPEDVTLNFLKAKGSLINSNIRERIQY
ncbi:hypothetical protein [Rosettibacter firmus]|uniref:hypothetical protein n=1 Tax=Rosettibacter firmus TaxID=3111522 RepID=UPI00336BE724